MQLKKKAQKCPCCGRKTKKIHDYREQGIKDIPAFGKKVIIYFKKRRYCCKKCNKHFQERNEWLPRYGRRTTRLTAYVIKMLSDERSFTSVGRDINLSVSTVIRIFDLVNYKSKEMPEVLSIDEFKGDTGHQKYHTIITDPVNKEIIDIVIKREKSYLFDYFLNFDRKKTRFVISDMWETYEDVANSLFKKATHIIDKYHFIRQVIWSFEAIRKEEQKKFYKTKRIYFKRSRKLLLKRYEYLKEEEKSQVLQMIYSSKRLTDAYWLKESFFKILSYEDREKAKDGLRQWILQAESSEIDRFISCGKTMSTWSKGILNSFEHPYTNGFTEGVNNKIKVLKRNAYGYRNFKRFRNRILHMFATRHEAPHPVA
jgi:transposase